MSVVLATWGQRGMGGGPCALGSERLRSEGCGVGVVAGIGEGRSGASGGAGGGGEGKVNGGNGAKAHGCAAQAPAMKQTSCGPAALSYVYGSRVGGGAPAAAAGGANGAGASSAGTAATPVGSGMAGTFMPAAGAAVAPMPQADGEGLGAVAMGAVSEPAAWALPPRVHAALLQHGMLDTAVMWVGGAPGQAYGPSAAAAPRASTPAASGEGLLGAGVLQGSAGGKQEACGCVIWRVVMHAVHGRRAPRQACNVRRERSKVFAWACVCTSKAIPPTLPASPGTHPSGPARPAVAAATAADRYGGRGRGVPGRARRRYRQERGGAGGGEAVACGGAGEPPPGLAQGRVGRAVHVPLQSAGST